MPMWSLVAAGRLDTDRSDEFRDQLAAVLANPHYQTDVSSLHIDGIQPVRVALHLPARSG